MFQDDFRDGDEDDDDDLEQFSKRASVAEGVVQEMRSKIIEATRLTASAGGWFQVSLHKSSVLTRNLTCFLQELAPTNLTTSTFTNIKATATTQALHQTQCWRKCLQTCASPTDSSRWRPPERRSCPSSPVCLSGRCSVLFSSLILLQYPCIALDPTFACLYSTS